MSSDVNETPETEETTLSAGGASETVVTKVETKKPTAPRPVERPAGDFSLDIERRGIGDSITQYFTRLRSGEPGALPSILGLIVLAGIFSQVSGRFLSRNNIGNLPGQGAYIAIIALGLVFVLLLGEIDLSAGTTGGVCAGFAAQAIFSRGLHHGISGLLYWTILGAMVLMVLLGLYLRSISGPIVVAIGVLIALTGLDKHVLFALIFAIALGCGVGIFIGWLVAGVGIPSFIVTLALFLAFQGLLLFALNSQPIGVNNYSLWFGLAHDNMSPAWSWVFTIVVCGGYFGFTALKSIRAQAKGLAADKMELVLLRAGVITLVGVVVTYFANQNRNTNDFKKIEGLPYAATIPIALMIVATIAISKTTWDATSLLPVEMKRRPTRRYRRTPHQGHGVHGQLRLRCPGRHLPGVQHGWCPARPRCGQHPAVRSSGCRHRWYVALRWPR